MIYVITEARHLLPRKMRYPLKQSTVKAALAVLLFAFLLPLVSCEIPAMQAVSGPSSGMAGNIQWTIQGDVMTLEGDGEIPSFYNNDCPWNGRKSVIRMVIFSGDITSIGAFAFYEFSSLKEIILPETLTSIGNNAFHGCTALVQIRIPDKVEAIGEYAFADCDALESIILGASLKTIGHYAFFKSGSLRSLTSPPAVESIGLCVTAGTTALEHIKVVAANPNYTDGGGNCIIDRRTATLIAGCKNTVIPSDGSVTEIATGSFHWCSGLTEMVIPDSVTTIREWAFDACKSLKSVTLGRGLSYLEPEAFSGCEKLKTIYNRSSLQLTKGSEEQGGVALYATTIQAIP